jgi:hypothetical protein
MTWRRSTRGDGRPVAWPRRSTWRASVIPSLVAVMAAALVSGSQDPLSEVLASQPTAPAPDNGASTTATPPPAATPNLPWAHASTVRSPASTSRSTPSPALVNATDIPLVALSAYERAAAVIDAADPTCQLDWTLLAAIGRIESDHGRFGGSSLNAQGVDHPAVVGPVLDGHNGTSLVRDTDAGRLDGDTRFDRAVGPMQFLPSTWASVAVDGDGDGRRNVQDIDDAALGSAVYLCSSHDDLSTPVGQRHALLRYNHSLAYVADVMAIARAYQAGSLFLPTSVPGTLLSAPEVKNGSRAQQDGTRHPGHDSSSTPGDGPSSQPSTGPGDPSGDPTDAPTDNPSDEPTTPTGQPTDGPTSDPTDDPTDGPSNPTGQPTDDPTGDPTDTPTPDPTDPTSQPTEPPILPDPLPPELAGLTPEEVDAINTAWPVCRDSLPAAWTTADLTECLSTETGMPADDADLLAVVDWIARLEQETSP